GLEPDQGPHASGGVLLAHLRHCAGSPSCTRILESHWLQRPEPWRVPRTTRPLLDGHATLEELELLPIVRRVVPGFGEGLVEAVVLLLGEGQVQVVRRLVVAPGAEGHRHVDAIERDHGSGRVVEAEELLAYEVAYGLGEAVAGERARRQHGDSGRYGGELFVVDSDRGM